MRGKIPIAFESNEIFPVDYEIPNELQYEFMKHSLMKEYGLTSIEAGKMTEYEYCLMVAFNNLNGLKEKYLMDKK